jgi:hypothetical protein
VRRARLGLAAAAAAALGALATPAGAEVVRLEAFGAAPPREGAAAAESLRKTAIRAALSEAISRAALELVSGAGGAGDPARVAEALGEDPFPYVVRFQVLEERGTAPPAGLPAAPGAEYGVRLEALVELDRVRTRLVEAGLLAGREGPGIQVLPVTAEGLDSYRSYRSLRDALASESRSVRPIEFGRGRAVLEVETERSPGELLEAVRRAFPESVRLVPLVVGNGELRLRVESPGGEDPTPTTRVSGD